MPNLFDKECQRRREFCDENKIDYKVPSFKSSDYTPGLEMVNTHESSSEDEEEVSGSDNAKAIAVSVQLLLWRRKDLFRKSWKMMLGFNASTKSVSNGDEFP